MARTTTITTKTVLEQKESHELFTRLVGHVEKQTIPEKKSYFGVNAAKKPASPNKTPEI